MIRFGFAMLLLAGCYQASDVAPCTLTCDRRTPSSCPGGLECGDDGLCKTLDDGDCTVPPPATSCIGLASTCGPLGNAPCCGSLLVRGGMFFRRYDVASDDFNDMTRPATVSDFRLDTYEVTVGRFRAFVEAGLGTRAKPPMEGEGARTLSGTANQGGWDPTWNVNLAANKPALLDAVTCEMTYQAWTDTPGARESRPMNCISWYEAMAFCAWDGGYLPTEAQSMYAASGGALQRAYPWSGPDGSTVIGCEQANYGGTMWPSNPCVEGGANDVGSESPAGDGAYGQADLSGNVGEWVLDWSAMVLPMPCNDCANLSGGSSRVVRGGNYREPESGLRVAFGDEGDPTGHFSINGARCARAP